MRLRIHPILKTAILAAIIVTPSLASLTLSDINQALQDATPGTTLSFTLSDDIVIPPYRTVSDPYSAPEWGSDTSGQDVDLKLSGLRADGSKAAFTGGERTDAYDLTRALFNGPNKPSSLEHLLLRIAITSGRDQLHQLEVLSPILEEQCLSVFVISREIPSAVMIVLQEAERLVPVMLFSTLPLQDPFLI